jgi:hypothetical protein
VRGQGEPDARRARADSRARDRATSQVPDPYPSAKIPSPTTTIDAREPPRPASASPPAAMTTATVTVRRGPSRWVTTPDVGMARIAPADMASSNMPSRPAERSRASRAAGTRANHDATPSPLSPKTTATPVRAASKYRGGAVVVTMSSIPPLKALSHQAAGGA